MPPGPPSPITRPFAPLYRRLRAKGKRGDVALGHCMRKLLHLVFAVWKTNRPFDEHHFPWEPATDTQVSIPAPGPTTAAAPPAPDAAAVGHTQEMPAQQVLTMATASAAAELAPVAAPSASDATAVGQQRQEPAQSVATTATASVAAELAPVAAPFATDETAVGHKRDMPAQQVVTTATASVASGLAPVNPTPAALSERNRNVRCLVEIEMSCGHSVRLPPNPRRQG